MGSPLNLKPSFLSSFSIVVVVVGLVAAGDGAPEVPCYFIFGDSLFDNGNNNNLNTLNKVNYPPYGDIFPAGPTGRFSDGRNSADIIGQLLGFDSFIPSFASRPNRSELLVGVNYASGSAGILFESGKQAGDNVDMNRQLRNHGLTVSGIASILSSRKSAYLYLAKCFYISDIGNNDYLNNYLLPQSTYIRRMYNPDQFAALLIQKYSIQIKWLYNLGARKVGLAGVSSIGCTPGVIATAGGTNGSLCVDSLNQLVAPFNSRLRSLVDRLNVDFHDAEFLYLDSPSAENIVAQAFGIKTVPCCGQVSSVTGLCIQNSIPCPVSVRQSYLFWDAFHPTEAASQIGASIFYQTIKSILPALSLLIIVFVGILGATIGGADGSSEVPCYFIFGDSLFDNGNNNNLQTPSKVNFLPYGVDFPAGPTGRYADGRNTADIVGELLGFDNFIPSFASKPNGSELLVGVNYASGGAGILVETGKQVRMYNLGARKVGLAGVLPVGCSPNAVAAANISVCDDSLNELVEPFNVRLRLLVDRFNVEFPDAKFVYLDSTLATNLALQGLDVKTVSCCEGASAADGSSRRPEVPCYFIFGDSLLDSGNNNNLRTLAKVNYPPYGVDFPAGPTGRFTNGRTAADILGELLGFNNFIPSFASNPNASELLVGVNYASGGAGILLITGKHAGGNVDMNKQLKNHDETVSSLVKTLGSKSSAQDHLAKCLYLSDMGNNDYLNNYILPHSAGLRKKYNPDEFATLLITKYHDQIKEMYNLGARKVALVGLAPIGCTPGAMAITNSSVCVDSLNKLVDLFNAQLRLMVGRLNADFPDAKFAYLDATMATNIALKELAVKSVPCCKVSSMTGFCIPNSVPCTNRGSYLFWDAFHPAEAANRVAAPVYYQAIKPIL
ncbi:GDSL esterase/lipase At1g29660 [Linum grandiflorum]